MINNVVLVGRLTKDIELKKTQSNLSTCTFDLACDRGFKDKDGNRLTDFIRCVAWRQAADFLNQYARKGNFIAVTGMIQTRSYDGQNGRVYVTEVVCDQVRLLSRNEQPSTESQVKQFAQDNNVPYVEEDQFSNTSALEISPDDLPFY